MYVLAPRLHAHGRPGGCVRPWAKTSPSASCVAVAVADRPAGTSNCVSIDECTTNRKPACCRPAAGPLGEAGSSARHGTAPQSAGAARNVSALLCYAGWDRTSIVQMFQRKPTCLPSRLPLCPPARHRNRMDVRFRFGINVTPSIPKYTSL